MKSIKLCIVVLSSCVLLSMCSTNEEDSLNIIFISGSNEYVSHHSLKEYKQTLENTYSNVKIAILQANGPLNEKGEFSNLEGTDALKDCDVLLTFVRRTTISGKAIDDIRKYVASGKPLVALRTSSHGFQSWPEFDKEVLGGNYNHHYTGEPEKREVGADGFAYTVGEPTGSPQTVSVNSANRSHPVLEGVTDFDSKYSLYKTGPIASDAKLLLMGKTEEGEEPVAWTRDHNDSRIVYIALGGVQDWKNPSFVRLVTNALFWSADFNAKKKETQ